MRMLGSALNIPEDLVAHDMIFEELASRSIDLMRFTWRMFP